MYNTLIYVVRPYKIFLEMKMQRVLSVTGMNLKDVSFDTDTESEK